MLTTYKSTISPNMAITHIHLHLIFGTISPNPLISVSVWMSLESNTTVLLISNTSYQPSNNIKKITSIGVAPTTADIASVGIINGAMWIYQCQRNYVIQHPKNHNMLHTNGIFQYMGKQSKTLSLQIRLHRWILKATNEFSPLLVHNFITVAP